MSNSNESETRRFICGSCYNEFPTLPDLTFHADFCFSTDQHNPTNSPSIFSKSVQKPRKDASISSHRPDFRMHHFRVDETAAAVNDRSRHRFAISGGRRPPDIGHALDDQPAIRHSITGLSSPPADRSMMPLSIHDHSSNSDPFLTSPSISKSNAIDFQRCDSDSAGNFLIDDSQVGDQSKPRIRGKNLSLAGIRVIAGSSSGNDPSGGCSGQAVEYRGLGARRNPVKKRNRGGKSGDRLDEGDQSGNFREQNSSEDAVAAFESNVDRSTDDDEFSDQEPKASSILTIPMRPYPHNVKFKAACTGPRQKWQYQPSDSPNIRLPDGRLKKSYRIHCPTCNKILWRQNLQQHMRVHTGQRPYACRVCSKKFGSSADLKKHSMTHEDQSKRACYQCPFCSWTGLGNLKRHVRMKHEGMEFDPASVVVTSRAEVGEDEEQRIAISAIPTEMDEESARKAEAVVEEVCQLAFNSAFEPPEDEDLWSDLIDRVEQDLRQDPRELLRNWRPSRIECNICWRIIRRQNFAEHRQIHDGRAPFECEQCSRQFRFRKRLLQHVSMHHGGAKKLITCECGQEFGTATKLKEHRQLKHGGNAEEETSSGTKLPWKMRKSVCYVCGLMISQPKMAAHLKEHRDGVQCHQCDQCPKKYRSSYFLRLHKAKVHQGYLPYKCLKCPFRSAKRDHVVDHMLEIHQELIDVTVALIDGITTLNHLPTRKCPTCHVDVFIENYDTHQKKHTHPVEYESMKRTKEEAFRKDLCQRRNNRVDADVEKNGSRVADGELDVLDDQHAMVDTRVSRQAAARTVPKAIRKRKNRKDKQCYDHSYDNGVQPATGPRRTTLTNVANLRRSQRIRVKTRRYRDMMDLELMESEAGKESDQGQSAVIDLGSAVESTDRSITESIPADQRLSDRSITVPDQQLSICDSSAPVALSKSHLNQNEPVGINKNWSRLRYQCLLCEIGFENIAALIQHDEIHNSGAA